MGPHSPFVGCTTARVRGLLFLFLLVLAFLQVDIAPESSKEKHRVV
jgi:hypothetical protein